MSSVKELEEKVKELMKEIERLKSQEDFELEYPFEYLEKYWLTGHDGSVGPLRWSNNEFDIQRYDQGHIFKNKEEAERERDKRILLTKFRQFSDKCNGDWKPKWINNQERKYFMGYLAESEIYVVDYCVQKNVLNLFGYFKNADDCERAIELFGDKIKELFMECE